jgi:ABC-type phosphate/phosphonate transport system ATPase subunit
MEYNIAIIGEQASGKTNCVRLLKGLHIEKRYFKTFAAEVSPMDILKDTVITVWDMPSENYEKYMDKMHGVIYVTKKRVPDTLDIPHVIVSNRDNHMTTESVLNAYISIVNFITKGEYSEHILQSRSFVAS